MFKTIWKSYFKNNEKKIPGNLLKKTWKNHGNIMEFCQSEKVGTLSSVKPRLILHIYFFSEKVQLT